MVVSDDRAGPSHGRPAVSFGAPADLQISIVTTEGDLESSGDSAALPPSERIALPEPDPELATMLSWAAKRVGVECPEPSRLDDWFLGAARSGSQHPAPVPFFPEVHEEVIRSWKTHFLSEISLVPFPLSPPWMAMQAKGIRRSSCWNGLL